MKNLLQTVPVDDICSKVECGQLKEEIKAIIPTAL
jgi:hypothetical protein